jgi:hypothetical protein
MASPADHARFCTAIEHGAAGTALSEAAAAVANSRHPLPETTAGLLDLAHPATFADAVALIRRRWANGRASHG